MIVEITADTIENFLHLAPEAELEGIREESTFGIAYTESLSELPDALLLFSPDEEEDEEGAAHIIASLNYFLVVEEKREQGIFTLLFSHLLDLLENSGTEAIRADIPMGEEYSLGCEVLEHFGFSFDLTERYELTRPLRDFGKLLEMSPAAGTIKGHDGILSLQDAGERQFGFAMSGLLSGDALEGYDLGADIGEYEAEVSSVILKDGFPDSFFLIKNKEGGLEVELLRTGKGASSDAALSLMAASCRRAMEKYGPDVPVRVVIRNDFGSRLLAWFFPEAEPLLVRRGYFYLSGSSH